MPADRPTSEAGEVAAACRDLVQVYPAAGGPAHALRGVSLDIPAGTITALIGPSGAGKSTLLRLLACLERPTVGEVTIGGRRTAHLGRRARRRLTARRIGYVFQNPTDNLLEYLTVAEHVRLAWRMRTSEPSGAVERLLDTTQLAGLAGQRPGRLSAGEQQRLAFAMAVAGGPALVIADEPTASLDPASTEALVGVLPALVADGQTLVIATHHPPIVAAADRVVAVRDGTLAAEGEGGGDLLAVIDSASRVHLPPGTADLFPTGRVRITAEGGRLRMEPE